MYYYCITTCSKSYSNPSKCHITNMLKYYAILRITTIINTTQYYKILHKYYLILHIGNTT